jgi:hypothetical protein
MITGILGDKSGIEARLHLLPGNKLVVSNSQVYGDAAKIEGLMNRDVRVEFTLTSSGANFIQIKESVTNTSDYRPTTTYTVRTELARVPVAAKAKELLAN